jgi:hypothetical protein
MTSSAVQKIYVFIVIFVAALGLIAGKIYPLAIMDLADRLIALLTMLVGVSLAISAVFSSPLMFSGSSGIGKAEADRIRKTVSEMERPLSIGLVVIYYVMILAILALITLSFFGSSAPVLAARSLAFLGAIAGALTGMALALALRLPWEYPKHCV